MRRPVYVGAALITALVLVSFLAARAADDAKKSPAADDCYTFVAPLAAVMEVMGDIFDAIPDKLKSAASTKFKDIKRESLFIAEIANLSTHVKENRGNKEWLGFAESMKAEALKMAEAAGKKDEAAVKSLHSRVDAACSGCHEKFRDQ